MSNFLAASSLATILVVLTFCVCAFAARSALPLAVHNLVWAVALLLLGSGLIAYDTIGALTWLVILAALVAFNVGYLAAVPRREGPVGAGALPGRPTHALVASRVVFGALLAAYGVGLAVYLLTIHQHFGIATLLTDPTSIRANRETPYMAMVPFWARVLLFTGPLLLTLLLVPRGIGFRLAPVVRVVLAGLLAGSMLLMLQRSNLFIGLLWTVSAWLFAIHVEGRRLVVDTAAGPRAVPIRRLAAGALGVALAGLLAFQLVALALGKTGTQAVATGAVSAPLEDSGLTSVVLYATSGIAAFDKLVGSHNVGWPEATEGMLIGDYNPLTWGGATFDYAFQVVPVVRPWPGIAPFVEVPLQTNVYTWYESLYRDFRVAGIVGGMLVIGYVLAACHRRRRASSMAFWLGALLLSVVMLGTFATRFNSVIHIVSALLVVLLAGLSGRRPPRTISPPTPLGPSRALERRRAP